MATTIYSSETLYEYWPFQTHGSAALSSVVIYRSPYPVPGSVKKTYLNKVWDSVASAFVSWETNYPDTKGAFYPGPGVYDVDTSDERIETVIHGRAQLL